MGRISAAALFLSILCISCPVSAQDSDNAPPVVELRGATADETSTTVFVSYIVFDADDDVLAVESNAVHSLPRTGKTDVVPGRLTYELYVHSDGTLGTWVEVRTAAIMIANEFDVAHPFGTGDFSESSSSRNAQMYSWDDPGPELLAQGFVRPTDVPTSRYHFYLVADDGINEPVYAVSDFTLMLEGFGPTLVRLSGWGEVKEHYLD